MRCRAFFLGFCVAGAAGNLPAQQVATVQLSAQAATLGVGTRQAVYATATDSRGTTIVGDLEFRWVSTDPNVVRVEADPVQSDLATLVGVGEGVAQVRVTVGGRSESMAIRVQRGSGPAAVLVIEPTNVQLLHGENRQLTVSFLTDSGTPAMPAAVRWASLNPSVATVTDGGIVTGLSEGQAVLQARATTGLARTATVTVANVPFGFAVPILALSPGLETPIGVVVPTQGNRPLNTAALNWRSFDERIVTVTPLGVARGVSTGRATIIAEGYGQRRELAVAVHRPVAELEVTPPYSRGAVAVPLQGTVRVTARSLAADGTPVPDAPIIWQVADSTVAAFDTASGRLAGRTLGRTNLVARGAGPGLEVTWTIDVIAGGLLVEPDRAGLGVGDTLALSARFTDAQGRPIARAADLTWTTLDANVATVTGSGTVTAVGVGRVAIVASTSWGRADTTVLFVQGPVLFTSTRGGSFDLYTLDPDALGRITQVTREASNETMGAFAPDGAHLAYVSDRDGNFELYVADADGGNPRRLTTTPASELTPRWTPDGRRLIYVVQAAGGRAQIWSVNADGSEARALTSGDAANFEPAVSPDGRRVAFTSTRDGNYEIYVMDADGGNQAPAYRSPLKESRAAWFPDGDLAFIQERVDGRRIQPVVVRLPAGGSITPISPPALAVTDYTIAPTGHRLVLEVSTLDDTGQQRRLVLLPLGGEPTDLPRQPGEQQASPAYRPPLTR